MPPPLPSLSGLQNLLPSTHLDKQALRNLQPILEEDKKPDDMITAYFTPIVLQISRWHCTNIRSFPSFPPLFYTAEGGSNIARGERTAWCREEEPFTWSSTARKWEEQLVCILTMPLWRLRIANEAVCKPTILNYDSTIEDFCGKGEIINMCVHKLVSITLECRRFMSH